MKKITNYFKDNYQFIIFMIIVMGIVTLFETLVNEETKDLIAYIVAIILILVFVLLIIYGIIYKYKSRKKIKLVDKNDYDTVEKYYNSCIFDKLNKDNEEYDLYDAFETIWDNCREFLNMHKKCIPKNELFLKEDIELIKKINSKNLNKIYEETNRVLDIIYKYYTEDGIRKI